MNIKHIDFSGKCFKDVEVGEVFEYHQHIYIKTEVSHKPVAVFLSDGTSKIFGDDIPVRIVSAELTVRWS